MDLVRRFGELVQRPEHAIALDEAALVIAACAQPELSVPEELARLDALAGQVHEHTFAGVVRTLFHDLHFTGNRLDYYDPRNSFLNLVVERRTGIPITLAVVLMEVGRRVDVPLLGVGMPGHFLVRDARDDDRFVDAFAAGRVLARTGCEQLFRQLHGGGAPFHEHYLVPTGRDQILRRMLANLRNVYVQRDDTASLTWVLQLTTQFPGTGHHELRELASVLSAHGAFDRAADTFERAAVLALEADEDPASDLSQAAILRARCN